MRQASMLMRTEQPTMHRSIARRVAWCGMHTVRYVHGVALHQSAVLRAQTHVMAQCASKTKVRAWRERGLVVASCAP